jgi:hypothetical protein
VILTLGSAGVTPKEVQSESATLEDAFVALTGRHIHEDEDEDKAVLKK